MPKVASIKKPAAVGKKPAKATKKKSSRPDPYGQYWIAGSKRTISDEEIDAAMEKLHNDPVWAKKAIKLIDRVVAQQLKKGQTTPARAVMIAKKMKTPYEAVLARVAAEKK